MNVKCSKVLRDKKIAVLWQVVRGNQSALEAAGFEREFMGYEYRMIKVCRTQAEALQTQVALKKMYEENESICRACSVAGCSCDQFISGCETDHN